jgi:hypothetical protein
MKILNPYRFFKGAFGSGTDAPTPKLIPPAKNNGLLKSISIFECVDLLCEGPIYGLVDQFGKKIYGLDMLKGIYLNDTPVMNYKGEYNYRNVLMEINFGTENQKALNNFKKVYIARPANFKLLGPINNTGNSAEENALNLRGDRDFVTWAKSSDGWPSENQDPFVYIHKIKNKDVKKLKISLLIEQLFDTVSEGNDANGGLGTNKATNLEINIKYGLDGGLILGNRNILINGYVQSPYGLMIGDGSSMGVGGTVNRNIGVGTMSGNDGGGPSAGGSFADDTTRNYWDNYLRDQWKSGEP